MFTISYVHPPPPGNRASTVEQYRAKSALRRPARPNTARSYAEDTWPAVSYPSGDSTRVSRAPRDRALACMRAAVVRQPPFIAARTCTASLPELRNTPRHRSATRYRCPSVTPTRLLPGPMPLSSSSVTRCGVPPGRTGSTVRANRVFRVLAGGSLRWAFEAASTSPVWASATTHDIAETSGTSGASRCGLTCVPERNSSPGRGSVARGLPGAPGSGPAGAAAAVGPRTRTPATQRAQAEAAPREENPIVI
ncbi:hypothetical protein GCM10010251_85890 [Streptomyces aurantiogriseus]|uniref:Uncharacterized protein n=1 Tax=Streptomyces aurantiogriseus TaxID=66870 RepID=A0A918KZC0_9ACTN|nr:hypothetical protein GCM10010251_85890 [Streptomyces aurantiogriseus]